MKKVLTMAFAGLMSLTLLAGCTSNETGPTHESSESEIQTESTVLPSADASLPQFVVYKENHYLLTANDSSLITKELIGEEIGNTTDFIDFTGTNIDESLFSKELANSINENAVFYKMNGYSDDFRILIECDGAYYICETLLYPENLISHTETIHKGTVSSMYGTTEYKDVSKEDAKKLLEIFSNTTKATISSEEYETIGQAQIDGKAYLLNGIFEDDTKTTFLVMPSLNLVVIGQEYYTSETLENDIAFVFDGLPQETEEIVY